MLASRLLPRRSGCWRPLLPRAALVPEHGIGAIERAHRRALSTAAASSEPAHIRAKKAAHVEEALKIVHAYAVARYDPTVNVSVVLNVDTKRSDERVRGNVVLPHSNGKVVRVAVFARGGLT